MKVKCEISFRDLEAGIYRRKGEVFEVAEERYRQILGAGKLVSPLPNKELVERIKEKIDAQTKVEIKAGSESETEAESVHDSEVDYTSMTKVELTALAETKGIKISKETKAQIIELLEVKSK